MEEVCIYGWNKKLNTVPPKEVTKAVLKLTKKFPDKKMIIHFLQPHHPFVGRKKIIHDKTKKPIFKKFDLKTDWDVFISGLVSRKEFWQAYKDNLKLVMKEVMKLTQKLKGKVVLTSDHGNALGEYGIYEHPEGVRIEELVKVPWVVLKNRKS